MKKITLLFLVGLSLECINLSAQTIRKDTIISDFENGYDGSSTSYVTWGANSSTEIALQVVTNPNQSGLNSSANALKVTATLSAAWEGAYSKGKAFIVNIDNSTTGYRYLHLKVYKPFVSSMLITIKTQPPLSSPAKEYYSKEVYNNSIYINKWDTITFDLLNAGSIVAGNYNGMSFALNKNPLSNQPFVGTYDAYIDDVYFSNSPYSKGGPIISGNKELSFKNKVQVFRLDKNTVKILAPESDGNLKIKIYNLQGRLLRTINKMTSDSYEVNLPNNNLYILHVYDMQGEHNIKF